MQLLALAMAALVGAMLLSFAAFGVRRGVHRWIVGYAVRGKRHPGGGQRHLLFCLVDHFEPEWGRAEASEASRRVQRWCVEYPALAARHRDADGRAPRHTFFYPQEEYRSSHMEALRALCAAGFGEVEVHIHHDADTSASFRNKMSRFLRDLHVSHGFLGRNRSTGKPEFGFIHGNWALDNSHPSGRWCGVNDEISILVELGCYADFTMPSAPDATQTRKINSIYYAHDDPGAPKSHDGGPDVCVGHAETPPGRQAGVLMMVQGPLALNWRRRKWGVFPRVENSDISGNNPPSAQRAALWVKQSICVAGREDWVVVKVHTHGANPSNIDVMLGEPIDRLFTHLEEAYNDGEHWALHYVTARELYNIVKAAEAGEKGNPGDYRDYLVDRPAFAPQQQPAPADELHDAGD